MKSESKAVEDLIQKKRQALRFFVEQLLSSEARDSIAKIILFGSLKRGEVEEDSDVDAYVVALNQPKRVSEACADASLETGFKFDESVEPLVLSVEEYREDNQRWYFSGRRVLDDSEEVYTVPDEEIRLAEANDYLVLASEYLKQSRFNLEPGNYRLVIDGSYNAAELCAKGLLVLKGKEVPKRHGSIVQAFSNICVKSGELPREIGRALRQGLELRNRARYKLHAAITEGEARAAIDLAEKLIQALEDGLAEG